MQPMSKARYYTFATRRLLLQWRKLIDRFVRVENQWLEKTHSIDFPSIYAMIDSSDTCKHINNRYHTTPLKVAAHANGYLSMDWSWKHESFKASVLYLSSAFKALTGRVFLRSNVGNLFPHIDDGKALAYGCWHHTLFMMQCNGNLSFCVLLLSCFCLNENTAIARLESTTTKGYMTRRRQLGVGSRPPYDGTKDGNGSRKDSKGTENPTEAPSLIPTLLPSSIAPDVSTSRPVSPFLSFSPSCLTTTNTILPSTAATFPASTSPSNTANTEQQLPPATRTSRAHSLLPFSVTFLRSPHNTDTTRLDRTAVTLTLEHLFFSRMHSKWKTLHSVHLVGDEASSSRAALSNGQVSQVTLSFSHRGRAIFITDESNVVVPRHGVYIPILQQVHVAQRELLSALMEIPELQHTLHDNDGMVLWTVQEISVDGIHHHRDNNIPNPRDNGNDSTAFLTASWVTFLCAVILTSMAFLLHRRRLFFSNTCMNKNESSSVVEVKQVLQNDNMILDERLASLTWDNLIDTSYSMKEEEMAWQTSFQQVGYMTVPQIKEREVVSLRSTRL